MKQGFEYMTWLERVWNGSRIILWILIIIIPLLNIAIQAILPVKSLIIDYKIILPAVMFQSVLLAGVIAAGAVLLGYIPGYMLGTRRGNREIMLFLLLLPLVFPRYVVYYAWTLLLDPTTETGRLLTSNGQLARAVGTAGSSLVLIFWFWPLAAILLGQGWKNIDAGIIESAHLEAKKPQIWRYITWPLLAPSILLAFLVCFVLALSEFATFNLAGIRTIGTELAVLYDLTGSERVLARAAWPIALPTVAISLLIILQARHWANRREAEFGTFWRIERKKMTFSSSCLLIFLLGFSVIIPFLLFITHFSDWSAITYYTALHGDEIGWSLLIAVTTAVIAGIIASGVDSLLNTGQSKGFMQGELPPDNGQTNGSQFKSRYPVNILGLIAAGSVFVTMFLPASLTAVSLMQLLSLFDTEGWLRQSWLLVSMGQAVRFAGVAFIFLQMGQLQKNRQIVQAAELDGANKWQTWRYIQMPQMLPLIAGLFLLIMMLSMTELSATMVLLPAGLPNFAQRLLNQMHYARDQQVIASCLLLMGVFGGLAFLLVACLKWANPRKILLLLLVFGLILPLAGCKQPDSPKNFKVILSFGRTGRGEGEFMYPRAIAMSHNQTMWVVDKTGRIQQFGLEGNFIQFIQMPQITAGKPVGLSIAPNGNLYVADTHYHRIMVFSPKGEKVSEFGKHGTGNGCFIYPTDIAFSKDKIFVSEYGGNDRISVFNRKHEFLFSFGTPGEQRGQLSRPEALAVDEEQGRLYVADACNHRIGIYQFDGHLLGYFGRVGRKKGELRYPYDLSIMKNGNILVCEYGNNRLQLFNRRGESLAVYGNAGRSLGELAYPWGAELDKKEQAYIVDAGNNRIQVWRLEVTGK